MNATTDEIPRRQLADVLAPALKVFVQAPLFASRIEAKILGSAVGQYVTLHSPGSKPGAGLSTLAPRIGDTLIIRFLVDGIAYGFTSCVTHLLAHPESLVFLEYPESIAQVSVRRDTRIPCRLPCNLIRSGGERTPALLLDISEGGCKVACRSIGEEQRTEGATTRLELTLPPPAEGVHEITGKVIRATRQRQSILAGIEFDDCHSELMTNLANFLCLDDIAPNLARSGAAAALNA
jgi:hypothetical protein